MARIMAFDYGTKRVGIAITDPLQIICTALDTIHSKDILDYIDNYLKQEAVEKFVVGMPVKLDNTATNNTPHVIGFSRQLKRRFPNIPIAYEDERFTSKMALSSMIEAGTTKKFRKDKSNIDKTSAVIILQSHLLKETL